MNIVFATNANSFWALEYIERVLLDYGDDNQISVISMSNECFRDEFARNKINVYTYEQHSPKLLKRMLGRKILMKDLMKSLGTIDIFHANYVDVNQLFYLFPLWRKSAKFIMTFWGSDLFRADRRELCIYNFFLKRADYITLMTCNMREQFFSQYGERFLQKTLTMDFGCPMYRHIDLVNSQMSKAQIKQYWGIGKDKVVVAIGYNRRRMQQHLKIIEAVSVLDKEILQKCIFVFQLGYGEDGQDAEMYIKEIEDLLILKGMEYLFINKFLREHESAILRLATDVFLYGQETDALSASFCEYLYAGCLVTKPSWLRYYELENRNITFFSYDSFEQLSSMLSQFVYGEISLTREEINDNKVELSMLNSWDYLALEWRKLYGIN